MTAEEIECQLDPEDEGAVFQPKVRRRGLSFYKLWQSRPSPAPRNQNRS